MAAPLRLLAPLVVAALSLPVAPLALLATLAAR